MRTHIKFIFRTMMAALLLPAACVGYIFVQVGLFIGWFSASTMALVCGDWSSKASVPAEQQLAQGLPFNADVEARTDWALVRCNRDKDKSDAMFETIEQELRALPETQDKHNLLVAMKQTRIKVNWWFYKKSKEGKPHDITRSA